MRGATLSGPSRRLRLVCLLLLSGFLVLAARAAHLTIFDSRGKGWGERQIRTVLRLTAPRGTIVDRRGVELAVTVQAPSIYVVPDDLEDPKRAARALARVLGMDAGELADELKRRRRFAFLKRWASREQAQQVRDLDLPGVGVLMEPRRAYPAGALAGQLIGFANIDGEGARGIEQQQDRVLRGRERAVTVERTADRRLLVVDPSLPRDMAGDDVRLTLDAAMQAAAEGALAEAVERSGARGGIAVTLDPRSGDILSLAEYPPIDPNTFRDVDYASTRSRAFTDAFEPGSTLKAFLVAGALEVGAIRPDESFDTGEGWMRVPGKTVRDHRPYGVLTPAEVLQVSSNVGAVLIGQRLGPRRHHELLRRFGFGRSTGSGFPQESAGLLRPHRAWKAVDHATVSFGQGLSVTPVQLAAATAALANGGVWQKPRLVDAQRQAGGTWEPLPREVGHRVVSRRTAATTLRMMESVVSASGTARRAALLGVRVAGKTGTAQKFDREAGRYSRSDYLAWFIGVAPIENPTLAVAIVIDEPAGPAHGGGDHAAPLFAQLASAQLAHLGLVTEPAKLQPERFEGVLAERSEAAAPKPEARPTPARSASPPTRKPPARKPRVARTEPAPSQPAKPAPSPAPSPAKAPAPAPAVAKVEPAPPLPEVSAPASDAASKRTTATSHLVPDFRGETLAGARRIAARDSLVLELQGDGRGLAIEQDPAPGTVLVGDQLRVRLRFSADSGPGGLPDRRRREREG